MKNKLLTKFRDEDNILPYTQQAGAYTNYTIPKRKRKVETLTLVGPNDIHGITTGTGVTKQNKNVMSFICSQSQSERRRRKKASSSCFGFLQLQL